MGETKDELAIEGQDGNARPTYEPPRLTPIGNLRDLLAGPGSLPCDGGAIQNGPDPATGTPGQPDQCGPVG